MTADTTSKREERLSPFADHRSFAWLIAYACRVSHHGDIGICAVGLAPPHNQAKKATRIIFPFASLRRLLPAIAPSWRFFDSVSDSPRIDYLVLAAPDGGAEHWQEFRPRPTVLTPIIMLRRLLWNPQWNENLFLVSLAERMVSSATPETDAHSERELLLRVARHLHRHNACDVRAYLQIRLRFVSRADAGNEVVSNIAFLSSPRLIAELITP